MFAHRCKHRCNYRCGQIDTHATVLVLNQGCKQTGTGANTGANAGVNAGANAGVNAGANTGANKNTGRGARLLEWHITVLVLQQVEVDVLIEVDVGKQKFKLVPKL